MNVGKPQIIQPAVGLLEPLPAVLQRFLPLKLHQRAHMHHHPVAAQAANQPGAVRNVAERSLPLFPVRIGQVDKIRGVGADGDIVFAGAARNFFRHFFLQAHAPAKGIFIGGKAHGPKPGRGLPAGLVALGVKGFGIARRAETDHGILPFPLA